MVYGEAVFFLAFYLPTLDFFHQGGGFSSCNAGMGPLGPSVQLENEPSRTNLALQDKPKDTPSLVTVHHSP